MKKITLVCMSMLLVVTFAHAANTDRQAKAAYVKSSFQTSVNYPELITPTFDSVVGRDTQGNYFTKQEFVYESGKVKTETTYGSWDNNTKKWGFGERSEYTYGPHGVITTINSFYDDVQWIQYQKEESVYNSNGQETETIVYQRSSDNWEEATKTEYSLFDSHGNATLEKYFDWVGNNWVEDESAAMKYEFEYGDPNSEFPTKVLSYYMDDDWVLEMEEIATFNAAGMPLTIKSYYVDGMDKELFSEDEITYSNEGYPTSYISYKLSELQPDAWDGSKVEITYQGNNPIAATISLNTDRGAWNLMLSNTYYYGSTISVKEAFDGNITVYPNPATDYIIISSENVTDMVKMQIMDINGKTILTKETTSSKPVSVAKIAAGMYLYQIEVDGKSYSGKLIIKAK